MGEPRPSRLALVLTLGVMAVSLAAIFVRLAAAPGPVVALYRMVLASVVIFPWTLRALRRTPLTRANWGYAVLAGVLLGAHFATWITSLSYTSVAASVALVATSPLWVALFSWLFLNVTPSLLVMFGILTAVLGGALISFGDLGGSSAPLLGGALALAGAICASGYLLLGRSAQRRGLSLQAYVGVAYGVAALVLLPLPLIFGFSYTNYQPATFLWVLLLALAPQLVGHTSFNYAVKHVDPAVVATVILLEPVGASLLALIIFGEVPSLLTALGVLTLLFGVALTIRRQKNPAPRVAESPHDP